MATFKPEIQNRCADGSYKVRIRVTHNRDVRRMPTHLTLSADEVTAGLRIKNQNVLDQCEDLIRRCRAIVNNLGYEATAMPVDKLTSIIRTRLVGDKAFCLDFIKYTKEKAKEVSKGTGKNYISMSNALCRFLKRNTLDISEIDTAFLRKFETFISNEPSQRGNNRKGVNGAARAKGGRAISAYLACVRTVHNKAKEEFNDEDRGINRIPYSPFKKFKIKPQPMTRKRGLMQEVVQAIIDLPYEPGEISRLNLAKDCFILSFALIGMNSVDMFFAPPVKRNTLVYNRRKTAGRREDKAEMKVRLNSCLDRLLHTYADPKGKRLFNFYLRYANPFNFSRAINTGLKQIGERLGLERLDFYAARHSWATLARSAGVDKSTVHEALNHAGGEMAITDIYIDRDWSLVWRANERVLDLFDWSGIGYDLL